MGETINGTDLPAVRARLQRPPDQQTRHPESGTCRALYDCLDIALTPTGPRVRMLLAASPANDSSPAIGTLRNGTIYEQFFTTVPADGFSPADVLDLYLHRGSFETVLADEDIEQDPDRWVSHTPCGQEFWQILSQWLWNLRIEFGQQAFPNAMRLTELPYSQLSEPAQTDEPAQLSEPAQTDEPAQATEPVIYGPPQWASRSYTKGFSGSDFALQPDGTLRCPADHPLYPQERRPEHDGSVRVLYAARIGHCRGCPVRPQCQENSTTIRPRRVSAVFWPQASTTSPPNELVSYEPTPSRQVLWGDWQRSQGRRQWLHLLRTQTVLLAFGPPQPTLAEEAQSPDVQTRARRAHWRLSWPQRLARNARSPIAPSLEVTIHGLPVLFAKSFGFDVLRAA